MGEADRVEQQSGTGAGRGPCGTAAVAATTETTAWTMGLGGLVAWKMVLKQTEGEPPMMLKKMVAEAGCWSLGLLWRSQTTSQTTTMCVLWMAASGREMGSGLGSRARSATVAALSSGS